MTNTLAVAVPPSPPSKWDVIPIHTSDVSTFMGCRRKWNWSSPARHNLRRRVEIDGIYIPFWFGSGIHYALEVHYHPVLKRDPVEAFQTWFEYQWKGGIVTEEWLERTYDNKPVLQPDKSTLHESPLYFIRGLRDILPNPDEDEFMGYLDLGLGMMTFFRGYAKRHDDFVVVSPECVFSVPLGFEAVDTREDSPNYGEKLEVHARGKRDAIIYHPESERFGITDYKTASVIGDDYFEKLETDPQCSTYIWASQEEARIHDLPYKEIDSVLYQALRKCYPKPPTPLKNGLPSLNRTEESTTAELFEKYVRENGYVPWFESNTKAQNYYTWLLEVGDENFIVRKTTYRNQAHIKNTGVQLAEIAKEMLNPNTPIYPHYSGDRGCLRCQFRAPCVAMQDGSDWEYMIGDGYETNRDR